MHPRMHAKCTCPRQHANYTHCIRYTTAFDVQKLSHIDYYYIYIFLYIDRFLQIVLL